MSPFLDVSSFLFEVSISLFPSSFRVMSSHLSVFNCPSLLWKGVDKTSIIPNVCNRLIDS